MARQKVKQSKPIERYCYITYTCPLCEGKEFDNVKMNTLSKADLALTTDYGGAAVYLKKERRHTSLDYCIENLLKMIKQHSHSGIS